jgi:hypothetical protein
MSFHIFHSKNPTIPSSVLRQMSRTSGLARDIKDVLNHVCRVGQFLAMLPSNLQRQVVHGGVNFKLPPSRRERRKWFQQPLVRVEVSAHQPHRAEPRKALAQGMDATRVESKPSRNPWSVSVALNAYDCGKALISQGGDVSAFRRLTRQVLEHMLTTQTHVTPALIEAFDLHCAEGVAANAANGYHDPVLPPAFNNEPVVRANVGLAWFQASLVKSDYDSELASSMLAPYGSATGVAFTQNDIAAWISMPPIAAEA